MSKNPTDRKILKSIYDMYRSEFEEFDKGKPSRSSAIYVPIDCQLVAERLRMHPELLFGRLYYHLDKKHGYIQDDGAKVHLFAPRVGSDKHAVNFPLLAAVLADLELSHWQYLFPIFLSIVALFLSIASFYLG